MSTPEVPKGERHPKFEIVVREEELERFEPDSEGGPVVGFVPDIGQKVKLVILEHALLRHPTLQIDGKVAIFRLSKPIGLRFTPEEWVAFYDGARNGDFDEMHNNPHHNALGDSTDPNGPIFSIPGENWRFFMDAVIRGKYNLPRGQESSIMAGFKKRG